MTLEVAMPPVDRTAAPVIKYDKDFADGKPAEAAPEAKAAEPVKATAPKGYLSYDEWVKAGKDPDEFKGVKAFEKNKELFDTISRNNRTIKELQSSVTGLMDHLKRVEENAIQKGHDEAVKNLRAAQLKATEIGDKKSVNEITDKLLDLNMKFGPRPEKAPEAAPVGNKLTIADQEALDEFKMRNKWFDNSDPKNDDLIGFAIQRETRIKRENPDLSLREVFQKVESDVKSAFSERFREAVKYSSVESRGDSSPSSEKQIGFNDLPEKHKAMIRTLQRTMQRAGKEYDIKGYIDQLKLIGEI